MVELVCLLMLIVVVVVALLVFVLTVLSNLLLCLVFLIVVCSEAFVGLPHSWFVRTVGILLDLVIRVEC